MLSGHHSGAATADNNWLPLNSSAKDEPAQVPAGGKRFRLGQQGDRVFQQVAKGLKRGLMLSVHITGTLAEEELENGLAGLHVYTVQRAVTTATGEQLIALRNPWGQNGWRGYGGMRQPLDWDQLALDDPTLVDKLGRDFGSSGDGWDPLGHPLGDGGLFWQSATDFARCWSDLDACQLIPNNWRATRAGPFEWWKDELQPYSGSTEWHGPNDGCTNTGMLLVATEPATVTVVLQQMASGIRAIKLAVHEAGGPSFGSNDKLGWRLLADSGSNPTFARATAVAEVQLATGTVYPLSATATNWDDQPTEFDPLDPTVHPADTANQKPAIYPVLPSAPFRYPTGT
eukprot:SAG22_NODE_380_length_11402_cov_8.514154_13_plen_343_part_00